MARIPVSPANLTRPAQINTGQGARAQAQAFGDLARAAMDIGDVFAQYEQVARDKALDETARAGDNELATLARENPIAPDEFLAGADEKITTLVAKSDPSIARDLERYLKVRRDGYARQIADRKFEFDVKTQRDNFISGIENNQNRLREIVADKGLSAAQLPEWQATIDEALSRVDALEANPLYQVGKEEAEKLRDGILKDAQESLLVGTIADEMQSAYAKAGPDGARARLQDLLDEHGSTLFADERLKYETHGEQYIQRRENERERAIGEAETARAKAQAEQYEMLRVGIADGAVTRADLDLAKRDGRIDGGQYASGVEKLNGRDAKAQKTAEALDRINGAVSRGVPLNPYSNDDRNAVDLYWEFAGGADAMASEPQAARQLLASYADSLGVLPPMAVEQLQGLMLHGDDGQRGAAMDTLNLLYERAQDAVVQALPGEQITDILAYSEMLNAGVSSAVAVARIDTIREARRSAPAKAMEDAAKKRADEIKPQRIANELDGFFGAPFAGGEKATIEAVSAYRQVFRAAYVDSGGNEKVAKESAKKQLLKVYGVSGVTGRSRTMQYPPEQYYHVPGADDKWMSAALKAEVEDWMGARGRKTDLGAIYLQADATTAAEAQTTGRPGYLIMVEIQSGDQAGMFEQIPGRYYFPDEPIRARLAGERLAKAKGMRERASEISQGFRFEKATP